MPKSINVNGIELTGIPDEMEIVRHSGLKREGIRGDDKIAWEIYISTGVKVVERDGALHVIED